MYRGETAISNTLAYSSVTYAAANTGSASNLATLLMFMVHYCDSAKAYNDSL